MQIVETMISGDSIAIRLADDAAREKAKEWIELHVPMADLVVPAGGNPLLGDPLSRDLATIQAAALFHVQTAIDTEMKRLRAAVRP
jgi:hypothetical protein